MSLYLRRATFLPLILVFGLGCERGLAPPVQEQEAKASLASGHVYSDSEGGVRFAYPAGMAVEAEHWPGVTEPGVIRHMYTVLARGQERLRVELWRNRGRAPLAQWFERHLAFMRDGVAKVSWGPVAAGGARGMHFAWPRSGQSTGQRIVLFPLGELVVRVTCQDGQDPGLVKGFQRLVGSLALLEARP